MLDTLWPAIEPHAVELLGLILTAIIAWVAQQFTAWTGIRIEETHRAALHSALMTAARTAIDRKMTGTTATDFIEGYVRQSVPDAMKSLKPSRGVLQQLARAKLIEAAV